ncbi:putative two-component response regulator [Magnetofaba australis IT-1]|uniref:Putative two-component response regulator n=1 Tax=Magnetofaba australis IT-1 TaxID=1434232 RepID=A0A1Y2K2K3_9PROT|nr:putative two-component response regulator [Magnetofaba australis IT-1]
MVTSARDGMEALRCCHEALFDVVILDRDLAGLSTAECVRRVRAMGDAARANVPVVILGSQNDEALAGVDGDGWAPPGANAERIGQIVAQAMQARAQRDAHPRQVDQGPGAVELATEAEPVAAALFDAERLMTAQQALGRERTAGLLPKFADNAKQLLERAQESLAHGDWPAAEAAYHRLAGSAGQMGFLALSQWARGQENLLQQGRTQTVCGRAHTAQDLCARSMAQAQLWLDEQG